MSILLLLNMPIDDIRAKQKADQTQAIKTRLEAGSIVRIGNLLPITGRYEVLDSDGGISNNGVKVYNTQEEYGDRVLAYPRSDDTIALDSEKGSIVRPPTAFPVCPGYLAGQVFNCEEPKKKKGQVWILYFFEGKLWVGGHQSTPEEVGSVSLYGVLTTILESDGGPGVLGYRGTSNLHVWGDSAGWHVTYQTFPAYPNEIYNHSVTFHSVTSGSHKKYSTAFAFGEGGTTGGNNQHDNNDRSFPLGAGFVSYRSNRLISSVSPEIIYDNTVYQTSSSVQQVTIGYMENAVPTFNQFSSSLSFSSAIFVYLYRDQTISYSGTIPIPHIDKPAANPVLYSGVFSSPLFPDWHSPYFRNFNSANNIIYPVLNIQSIHNYPIMCDRSSTYYIQESVASNGANASVQRIYELRSTDSQTVIATNTTEPRFFGIRWDLRDGRYVEGAWATPTNYRGYEVYKRTDYSDQVYYYPDYRLEPNYHGERVQPIGHFKQAPNPLDPTNNEFDNYPYFATFSGGQVVTIETSEINKAKTGGADLQRRSVAVDGSFSDLGTIFCYPIPATAIIYHWSTTA